MPSDPKIFHITHVDNLAEILRAGGLWCDRERIARQVVSTNIGHKHIKKRRLSKVVMTTANGTLADYVPFNFCPRSVMLCAVSRGHQDYVGGQEAILHLTSTINLAIALGRPWAFTDRHAELAHALHFDDRAKLAEVSWHVMPKRQWSSVKEERQAEFLVKEFFPWAAVTGVAAMTEAVAQCAQATLATCDHRPPVTVRPEWYYEEES